MKYSALAVLVSYQLTVTPTFAQDAALDFNVVKLCAWQLEMNSMKKEECLKLEAEGRAKIAAEEPAATPERKMECLDKVGAYAKDSGFASSWQYGECLKNGPDAI